MRKLTLAIALTLVTIVSNAQHKSLDSLKKLYYSNYDSSTANWYLEKHQKSIEKSFDEFENETTYRTSFSVPTQISKIISKGKTYYYLSVDVEGSTLNYGLKGLSIIFKDKSKFVKPNAKIDVRYSPYKEGWVYSVFILLTPAEVKLFQTKLVDKFKLYIYDGNMNNETAFNFLMEANYITTKK